MAPPESGGRMLGWIEKVVPQPPVSSPILVVVEKDTQAVEAAPVTARQLIERSPRSAAEGFKEHAPAIRDSVSTTDSPGRGVLTWISQGLGKVMPQPAQNSPVMLQEAAKSFEASIDIPDVTEVQSIKDEKEEEEEEEIVSVTEEEEEEQDELYSSSDNNALDKIGGKKVITWIMEGFEKMMPQPENMKKMEEGTPGDQAAQWAQKENSPASPPSAPGTKHRASTDSQSTRSLSLFPRTLGGDGSSVLDWFVQGLEKVMPQPVTRGKEDGQSTEAADLGPGQESKS
ncbi:cyclic nucleotide-gated cation channel beta-1-like [Lacerta agilis]|uniref:cyclic nucleotide-gated cation channel beta-1-like n=1 Tax=Lacerta agilis TaxID=80427 RepID=UPI0014196D73|nr:cyclic nucleotide-gated cation channel beta-1-like [Lacerta agilis]